ncbi:hypothetical protein SAMN02745157_4769 [Kaistia soli DSM 19436]|uniref:Uncharacterized protein n=1 Tax=Kaistia soli DSM 19436 TaxID=1122133 RepID=A0A1M5MGI0_9HYPH|nr:hypothetical protein SAMN02745157_4769 [Kaistia soli DSM 19436]
MTACFVERCEVISDCARFAGRVVLTAAAAIVIVLAVVHEADACQGCGCRGGPGYRAPNGRCVSWAQIGRICGSPPTTHCAAEGPNAGADEAAQEGQRIQRLKDAAGKNDGAGE